MVTFIVTFALALSGCAAASADTEPEAADCQPSPVGESDGTGFPEAQLASDGIDGWALLWIKPPWKVDEEVKVVWRLTGSGSPSAVAIGPDDTKVDPSWPLEQHGGSNWERPGDEWGSGWILPAPGCWEIRLSRDEGSASLWLEVVEPA